MWYLALLLLTLSFDYGHGFVCHEELEPCLEIQRRITSFPKNQEELTQTCTDLTELTACMAKASDSCKEKVPPEWRVHPDYYPAVLKNISQICDQETSLHEDLVSYLACYEQIIRSKSEVCSEMADDILLKEGLTKKYDPVNYCLTNSIKYTCILENIEDSCGEAAESTALEIIGLLKSMNDYCTGHSLSILQEKMDDFDLTDSSKIRLLQLIEALQPDSIFPITFN